MCGILGQLNYTQKIEEQCFNKMRDVLVHRGPNDAGTWLSADGLVALGHQRLSFLDLTVAGHQPMTNENQTLWLTYNGEIYNYTELTAILTAKGHCFKSTSDSEVLLHGYEEWGYGLLDRIKGMFAFGIWDAQKKNSFLSGTGLVSNPCTMPILRINSYLLPKSKPFTSNPKRH